MNSSTQLAKAVLRTLMSAGVTDAVLSPGSRSTPLALEFAAAARLGTLRLHVRIDERSAGFLALGIAKRSGRPVPVVCTSGTAVANLAPAVVEAAYSGVPLIAATADRPDRLRGVGSNQTIDQVGFFGQQVLASIDVHADGSRGDATAQEQAVARAIAQATAGPGPIQINLAFDEPLVPDEPADGERLAAATPMLKDVVREPIDFALADIGMTDLPAKGLVLVGDVPTPQIAQQAMVLAQACGWPLVCEPSGNGLAGGTAIPHASLVAADVDFRAQHPAELVITVGRFGLSRPIVGIVRDARHHISVSLGGRDKADPLSTSELNLAAVPREPSNAGDNAPSEWLTDWRTASDAVAAALSRSLQGPDLTGAAVAKQVWDVARSEDQIFVASSRTVRYFEAVCGRRSNPPWVLGNRGTSGIDGLVSTAWGSAVVANDQSSDAHTYAVMGDLAFLHDHNGLVVPQVEDRPNLTIVVVDNNGGGIFASLEQGSAEFEVDFERVFGTPHDLDLVAVGAALGIPTVRVQTVSALRSELDDRHSGVRIVVASTSRQAENDEWNELHVL